MTVAHTATRLLLAVWLLSYTTAAIGETGDHQMDSRLSGWRHFCNTTGATIEQMLEMSSPCRGCAGRCGSTLGDGGPGSLCDCDVQCVAYGTCCQDIQTECPDIHQQALTFNQTMNVNADQATCEFERVGSDTYMNVLIINSCRNAPCLTVHAAPDQDINLWLPVYDPVTNASYVNYECARCNGVQEVIPWHTELYCTIEEHPLPQPPPGPIPPGGITLPPPPFPFERATTAAAPQPPTVVDTEDTFRDVYHSFSCFADYTCVEPCTPRRCYKDRRVTTCSSSCANPEVRNGCERSEYQNIIGNIWSTNYKNWFCVACNHEALQGDVSCVYDEPAVANPSRPYHFSLSVLVDFDVSRGLQVGQHASSDPPVCPDGHHWSGSACVLPSCPPGRYLVNGTCITYTSNMQLNVSTCVTFNHRTTGNHNRTHIEESYFFMIEDLTHMNSLCDQLEEVLACTVVQQELSNVTLHQGSAVDLRLDVTYNLAVNNSVIAADVVGSVISALQIQVESVIANHSQDSGYTLKEQTICSLRYAFQGHSNVTACHGTWQVYPEDEVHFNNDSTLYLNSSDKLYNYTLNQYGNILVCLPLDIPDDDDSHSFALGILTLVLTLISLVCLLIRLILQGMIPSYQTVPGIMQFHLVLSMFCAYLCLLISPFLSVHSVTCTISAVLKHYFFLAMFCWMNAIAVHSYSVFRPSNFSKASEAKSVPLRYCIPAWGVPLVIATVAIIMEHTLNSESNMRPDYGDNFCWFTSRLALLVYFGVPLLLSILINIILFSLTAIILHRSFQKSHTASAKENSSKNYKVYLRLFILMGLTWSVSVAATFSRTIVLWYVYVILNSSLGIMLFVAFVCTRRIKEELQTGEVYSYISSKFRSTTETTNSEQSMQLKTSSKTASDA